jgi:prolyl-tRNA synthetase
MVQDKKAIQAGTSHYLGQNFAKAQNITFVGRENKEQHVHTTSWGVSTRLIGTLIMAHADDDGLVLPPRVAPQQIVIIPVTPKPDTKEAVLESCQAVAEMIRRDCTYAGAPIRVHVDDRDFGGGVKKWEWVKKGVPIRLEIGPRDVESRKVCVQRRDRPANEKDFVERDEFFQNVEDLLAEIHQSLLTRATELRDDNITVVSTLEDFTMHWNTENPGWITTPWAGSREQEEDLSKEHKITIRCLPLDQQDGAEANCILTGEPTKQRALWGRSY